MAIIGGAVYFQDLAGMSPLSWLMCFLGLILTIIGIVMLSQREMPKLEEEGEALSHRVRGVSLVGFESVTLSFAGNTENYSFSSAMNTSLLGTVHEKDDVCVALPPIVSYQKSETAASLQTIHCWTAWHVKI